MKHSLFQLFFFFLIHFNTCYVLKKKYCYAFTFTRFLDFQLPINITNVFGIYWNILEKRYFISLANGRHQVKYIIRVYCATTRYNGFLGVPYDIV